MSQVAPVLALVPNAERQDTELLKFLGMTRPGIKPKASQSEGGCSVI